MQCCSRTPVACVSSGLNSTQQQHPRLKLRTISCCFTRNGHLTTHTPSLLSVPSRSALGQGRRLHRFRSPVPLRFADAPALHEHVVLAGERDRAQGNDEEQIRNVRLGALATHHFAFGRLAYLEDDLLQEVWELLDNRHGLAGRQTDSVHWGGGVVARSAEAA